MKYYFELQYRRALRMIRELGMDPYVGVLIGIGQFVFISFIPKLKERTGAIYLHYGIQLPTADNYEQRFIQEPAAESIRRTEEAENI